jgi:hypothetical protein
MNHDEAKGLSIGYFELVLERPQRCIFWWYYKSGSLSWRQAWLGIKCFGSGNSPTLLIVGGMDMPVIEMNKTAYDELHCIKKRNYYRSKPSVWRTGKLSEVAVAITWYKKI